MKQSRWVFIFLFALVVLSIDVVIGLASTCDIQPCPPQERLEDPQAVWPSLCYLGSWNPEISKTYMYCYGADAEGCVSDDWWSLGIALYALDPYTYRAGHVCYKPLTDEFWSQYSEAHIIAACPGTQEGAAEQSYMVSYSPDPSSLSFGFECKSPGSEGEGYHVSVNNYDHDTTPYEFTFPSSRSGRPYYFANWRYDNAALGVVAPPGDVEVYTDESSICLGRSTTLHWNLDAPYTSFEVPNQDPLPRDSSVNQFPQYAWGEQTIQPEESTSYTFTSSTSSYPDSELGTVLVNVDRSGPTISRFEPYCEDQATGESCSLGSPRRVNPNKQQVITFDACINACDPLLIGGNVTSSDGSSVSVDFDTTSCDNTSTGGRALAVTQDPTTFTLTVGHEDYWDEVTKATQSAVIYQDNPPVISGFTLNPSGEVHPGQSLRMSARVQDDFDISTVDFFTSLGKDPSQQPAEASVCNDQSDPTSDLAWKSVGVTESNPSPGTVYEFETSSFTQTVPNWTNREEVTGLFCVKAYDDTPSGSQNSGAIDPSYRSSITLRNQQPTIGSMRIEVTPGPHHVSGHSEVWPEDIITVRASSVTDPDSCSENDVDGNGFYDKSLMEWPACGIRRVYFEGCDEAALMPGEECRFPDKIDDKKYSSSYSVQWEIPSNVSTFEVFNFYALACDTGVGEGYDTVHCPLDTATNMGGMVSEQSEQVSIRIADLTPPVWSEPPFKAAYDEEPLSADSIEVTKSTYLSVQAQVTDEHSFVDRVQFESRAAEGNRGYRGGIVDSGSSDYDYLDYSNPFEVLLHFPNQAKPGDTFYLDGTAWDDYENEASVSDFPFVVVDREPPELGPLNVNPAEHPYYSVDPGEAIELSIEVSDESDLAYVRFHVCQPNPELPEDPDCNVECSDGDPETDDVGYICGENSTDDPGKPGIYIASYNIPESAVYLQTIVFTAEAKDVVEWLDADGQTQRNAVSVSDISWVTVGDNHPPVLTNDDLVFDYGGELLPQVEVDIGESNSIPLYASPTDPDGATSTLKSVTFTIDTVEYLEFQEGGVEVTHSVTMDSERSGTSEAVVRQVSFDAAGVYPIYTQAEDFAGNVSDTATTTFTIRDVDPPKLGQLHAGHSDRLLPGERVHLEIKATDESGIQYVQFVGIRNGDAQNPFCSHQETEYALEGWFETFCETADVAVGDILEFYAFAQDTQGNQSGNSNPITLAVVDETTIEGLSFSSYPSVVEVGEPQAVKLLAQPAISGSGSVSVHFRIDEGLGIVFEENGSTSYTVSQPSEEGYTATLMIGDSDHLNQDIWVHARATSESGDESSEISQELLVVDTIPPHLTRLSGGTGDPGDTVMVIAEGSDASGEFTVTFEFDGAVLCEVTDLSYFECPFPIPSESEQMSTYTVEVYATDSTGNRSWTYSVVVSVSDNKPADFYPWSVPVGNKVHKDEIFAIEIKAEDEIGIDTSSFDLKLTGMEVVDEFTDAPDVTDIRKIYHLRTTEDVEVGAQVRFEATVSDLSGNQSDLEPPIDLDVAGVIPPSVRRFWATYADGTALEPKEGEENTWVVALDYKDLEDQDGALQEPILLYAEIVDAEGDLALAQFAGATTACPGAGDGVVDYTGQEFFELGITIDASEGSEGCAVPEASKEFNVYGIDEEGLWSTDSEEPQQDTIFLWFDKDTTPPEISIFKGSPSVQLRPKDPAEFIEVNGEQIPLLEDLIVPSSQPVLLRVIADDDLLNPEELGEIDADGISVASARVGTDPLVVDELRQIPDSDPEDADVKVLLTAFGAPCDQQIVLVRALDKSDNEARVAFYAIIEGDDCS